MSSCGVCGTGSRRGEGANRRSFRSDPQSGGWAVGRNSPDCHESGVLSFIGLTAVNVDFPRSRFFITKTE